MALGLGRLGPKGFGPLGGKPSLRMQWEGSRFKGHVVS